MWPVVWWLVVLAVAVDAVRPWAPHEPLERTTADFGITEHEQ